MKIANDEQQKILDIIRTKIEKGLTLPNENDRVRFCDLDNIADVGLEKISRALRQFDSNISIVTVMGMLKAGKSTFVNLLARHKNASPVGYGKDTTLRPALICMAKPGEDVKKGKIIVYETPSEENDEAYGKRMDDILDELRGIAEPGKKLPTEEFELTQENLEAVLCSEAGSDNALRKEPMLVVVKIPYNKEVTLLKDGNCLLDMPGLDSATAEVSLDSDKYNKLIEQCDMVLCLQSSVAPLNEKAVECFKKVTRYRSNATVWGIQNTMLNKPWMDGKVIKEEQIEQRKNVWKLMEKMQKNPSLSVVNLGLAYAGWLLDPDKLRMGEEMPGLDLQDSPININPEELQRVSKFSEVEGQIIRALTSGGQPVRMTYCKEILTQQLAETAKKLGEHKEKLEADMSELQKETEKQKKICNNWDHALKNLRAGIKKSTVIYETEKLEKEMLAVFDAEKANLELEDKKNCKGSIVDGCLAKASETCFGKANNFLKTFCLGRVQIGGKDEEQSRAMSDVCPGVVNNAVDQNWAECEGTESGDLASKPSCPSISPDLPWRYSESVRKKVSADKTYEISSWHNRIWEPRFKFREKEWDTSVDHIITGYITQVKDILDSQFDDWADGIVRQAAQDTMRGYLDSKKAKIAADSEKIAQIREELKLISGMQDVIKECQQYSKRIR